MHPAYVVLTCPSTQEAADALHWSYTDRLLAHPQPIQPLFSQEECQELIRLLNGVAMVHPYTVLPFLIVPLQILPSNLVFHTHAWSRESYYESVRPVFALTAWNPHLILHMQHIGARSTSGRTDLYPMTSAICTLQSTHRSSAQCWKLSSVHYA